MKLLDVCFACLALYLTGRLVFVYRNKHPLPPGPPGWPLIGNLFDIPTHAQYKAFGAMSRKYGPIISLKAMGTRYVVLHSLRAANDLLERRSAITSNKLQFTMGGDLVGWRNALGFLQYGDTYQKHRKFFRQHIGTKSSLKVFYPVQADKTRQFLCDILKSPNDLPALSHSMASAIILKISHGYTVKEDSDPLVGLAVKAMNILSACASPGRFIVDTIPTLKYLPEWFPGCGFHKVAKQWRETLNEAVNVPYEFVLERQVEGDAAPSFVSRQLQEGITPEEEWILKWASLSMYLGGSDTTPSTISAFFLAMTIHSEVLKKGQAELDSVVGNERLPTFEDRDALPYVNAICIELLRWHVVAPLVTHSSTQDIVYEGYFVPKGTCLVGNIRFMLSDPETYPKPDAFDPERYLGEHRQSDPRNACFGYGRRSCPGALLAESTIYICVAMALATLDVSRYVENGVELVPKYETVDGAIQHVKPFKCRIAPRSEKAEDLLRG